MKLNSFDKVKQLTEEMVAIPSINKEPGGESAVARYIQDFYMSLPYFQAHPEQVKCFQTKNDFVVRHSTLAYVKGTKGNSNRTVILIGHIDTVGVDDFGTIREYAFRCEELPAKLRETFVLPQEVIDDIESGEYLFGRKFSKIWVFMYPLFIGIACAFSNVTTMYMITDGFMAIIVILNMIGLLLMCKQVKDLQKEYYNTPGMYYLADKAAKEAKKAAK